MSRKVGAIVTVPPYAPFIEKVARHSIVRGLRLNTVMPLKGSPTEVLKRLSGYGKPLYIDLKGRQLRVVGAAIPPFSEVRLSHPIECPTPVTAYFNDGKEMATVLEIDGNRLILEDGPRRIVGPGESVNIVHPALRIRGTLTETDRSYIRSAGDLGLHDYMLSYVESEADIDEMKELDPDAEIVLKIESSRGIDFAREHGADRGRLMVARGDLYIEVLRPHHLIGVLRELIACDPEAIVASRIFPSLAFDDVPAAQDLTDVAFLYDLGYRTFMLGDEVCLQERSVLAALNLLEAIAKELAS